MLQAVFNVSAEKMNRVCSGGTFIENGILEWGGSLERDIRA